MNDSSGDAQNDLEQLLKHDDSEITGIYETDLPTLDKKSKSHPPSYISSPIPKVKLDKHFSGESSEVKDSMIAGLTPGQLFANTTERRSINYLMKNKQRDRSKTGVFGNKGRRNTDGAKVDHRDYTTCGVGGWGIAIGG